MKEIYLLLGTNLGERLMNLELCKASLEEKGVCISRFSKIYETAPWGYLEQPSFYNQAIEVSSSFSPVELLTVIKEVELNLGRKEADRWKERLIDIDILYFGEKVVNEENLIIPHPLLQNRKFALVPLNDIAAGFIHPIFKITNEELLKNCLDELEVTIVNPTILD